MHLAPGLNPSPTTCLPTTYVEATGTPAILHPLTMPIHLVSPDSSVVSSDELPGGQPTLILHCSHGGIGGHGRQDMDRRE